MIDPGLAYLLSFVGFLSFIIAFTTKVINFETIRTVGIYCFFVWILSALLGVAIDYGFRFYADSWFYTTTTISIDMFYDKWLNGLLSDLSFRFIQRFPLFFFLCLLIYKNTKTNLLFKTFLSISFIAYVDFIYLTHDFSIYTSGAKHIIYIFCSRYLPVFPFIWLIKIRDVRKLLEREKFENSLDA